VTCNDVGGCRRLRLEDGANRLLVWLFSITLRPGSSCPAAKTGTPGSLGGKECLSNEQVIVVG